MAKPPVELPIHIRHVYSEDGKVRCEMRVFCPDRDDLVGIEGCTECVHWSGIELEPTGQASHLACSPCGDAGPAPGRTALRSIMSRAVVCVDRRLDMKCVADILSKHNIGAAPVVDDSGKLLGIISRSDVLGAVHQGVGAVKTDGADATVDRVMTPFVFALREDAAIGQAAALMATEGIHHLLVVSPVGKLVGIISALDVVGWVAHREGYAGAPRPVSS